MSTSIDLSKYEHTFSFKNKITRLIWNICYWLLFRPFASGLFRKWRNLILKIFGAKVDFNSNIYSSVKIWLPSNLEIGKYSTLGPFVNCYNQGKVKIGNHTTISQNSHLCASTHDITDVKNHLILKPITISDQVWVAADSFVGPGVVIQEGAVVGARSAVFKEVKAWCVVGGNPAKFIKNRELK